MKIITPLKVRNRKELETALSEINERADIVEIWLDVWEDPLETLGECRDIFESGEFLAVCKSAKEKGTWKKSPVEKELVLQCFLDSGGKWVDLDIIQNSESLIRSFEGDSLILSWHDFDAVAENLVEWKTRFESFDADIYKWALTPQSQGDLDRLLDFAQKNNEKYLYTTMGELGVEGRAALEPYTWGAFFALNEAEVTASGQRVLGDL